ncbi:MAG: hypothetical protein E6K94_03495 [Thaumarchaeota archaeon]|nr:MAG: hypothetical protein E6K94_03495 [Nitrososphaerota archaeon]
MFCLPEGTEQWIVALTSPAATTFIIGAAGIAVSIITYVFQKRQLRLRALLEVFSVLNLPEHREARRVTYGERSDASYDILKISRPNFDGAYVGELERVVADIFRGDMNNAATLIYHGLMDETIFVEEYWWIILRCWDNTKDTINKRRSSGTGALSYMRNLEKLNSKAEKYAKKRFQEGF